MSGLVLFGVGSRICVDIVETCRRNDRSIAAAIRNVSGPVYVDESVRVIDAAAVAPDIAALPFLLPLFGPGSRRTALAAATALGFQMPASLVDRTAIVASDCRIDPGVFVNAGCIIGGDSALERFVFCNRGASIGHHCRIGPFVSIGPGAVLSGSVTIGEGSMIGAGAIVLPTTSIGSGAVIAAGAVVGRDVPDGGFAAGNPARIRLAGG
jgi:sugar O-acyltransferase (sialic acid O-acetyltransferase NeuD family)